jgi:hypothetical protein
MFALQNLFAGAPQCVVSLVGSSKPVSGRQLTLQESRHQIKGLQLDTIGIAYYPVEGMTFITVSKPYLIVVY